jgi:hypothetical protein
VLKILHRFGRVPSALEVQNEFSDNVVDVWRVRCFESLTDALVQLRPDAWWDAFIEHFLIHSMQEAIAGGERAIRPLDGTLGLQPLASPRQSRTLLLDRFWSPACSCRHSCGGKLNPGNTCRFQHALVFWTEALKLLLDHVSNVGWSHPQVPLSGVFHQRPALHEIIDHAYHKQRIAVCVLMNQPRQVLQRHTAHSPSQACPEIRCDLHCCEQF